MEGKEFSTSQQHVAAPSAAITEAEPSALADLLTRVEAATGRDREIDCLICEAFGEHRNGIPYCAGFLGIGAFTSSVDAALALVERVLPGWAWCTRTNHEGAPFGRGYFANVYPGDPNVDRTFYDAKARTLPLAILVALLKAKMAESAS